MIIYILALTLIYILIFLSYNVIVRKGFTMKLSASVIKYNTKVASKARSYAAMSCCGSS